MTKNHSGSQRDNQRLLGGQSPQVDDLRDRRATEDTRLMTLAAEPVPLGSGLTTHGRGKYIYLKTNIWDGSMRALHFHSHNRMREAMAIGIATDSGPALPTNWAAS